MQEFETNHKKLCEKAETRLQNLRDDLELRRKVRTRPHPSSLPWLDVPAVIVHGPLRQMEIHEIEERKHRHINDLMDNFEKVPSPPPSRT